MPRLRGKVHDAVRLAGMQIAFTRRKLRPGRMYVLQRLRPASGLRLSARLNPAPGAAQGGAGFAAQALTSKQTWEVPALLHRHIAELPLQQRSAEEQAVFLVLQLVRVLSEAASTQTLHVVHAALDQTVQALVLLGARKTAALLHDTARESDPLHWLAVLQTYGARTLIWDEGIEELVLRYVRANPGAFS